MSTNSSPHFQSNDHAGARVAARPCQRGVALLITLILLTLLSAASVAIVLLVSSDTMINGYYRNFRGSFYAADSGVNVIVESMKSAVSNAATDTANPPLPTNGTIPATVTSSYSGYQSGYYTFGDTGSWAGKFTMISNPGGTAVIGAPTVSSTQNPNDPGNATDLIWTFAYPYTLTVKGQSTGSEAEEITETGYINYTSTSGAAAQAGNPSFSKWAAFITNFSSCQGPLVPGTMNGPFFTDGQWNFGDFSNPGYTFNGSIGQVGTKASWWKNNSCTNSAAPPNGFKNPTFNAGGLQLNQPSVQAPSDSYSQLQAVLDGQGTSKCTGSACQTLMNSELKTVTGTAPPATGTIPTGVYLPYYTGGSCTASACFGTAAGGGAGGFYVQGNATITLSATTTGSGSNAHNTQTYAIKQGSTTTTIVVDNVANTTTVTSGSTSLTIQGAPEQVNASGQPMADTEGVNSNPVNPTLVYVNGTASLTGPYNSSNSPLPAIQNGVGVTVVGSSAVNITGDLEYASSPVSVPSDVLNSSTNAGVLGVYTTGNITLSPDPGGNLTVNGSLAALSGNTGSSATSGFETNGSIGTWTILGGRAEDQAHAVSISAGNTYYDQRFANNFGPPWFPTAVPQTSSPAVPASQSVSVTRSSWSEVNRQ